MKSPVIFPYLEENILHLDSVTISQVAVTTREHPVLEVIEGQSVGGSIVTPLGDGCIRYPVRGLHPKRLPSAVVVKIDAEGSELDILSGFNLSKTELLIVEFHAEEDVIPGMAMIPKEFGLEKIDWDKAKWGKPIGVFWWVKKELKELYRI